MLGRGRRRCGRGRQKQPDQVCAAGTATAEAPLPLKLPRCAGPGVDSYRPGTNRFAVLADDAFPPGLGAGDLFPAGLEVGEAQVLQAPASGAVDAEDVQAQMVPALNRRARRSAAAAVAEHSAGTVAARAVRRGHELELMLRSFSADVEAAMAAGSPFTAARAAFSRAAANLEDAVASRALRELIAAAELGFAGAGAARAVVQLAEAGAVTAAADSIGLELLAEVM